MRVEISDSSILSKTVNVIERSGEEELLLFASSIGKLFELNKTGGTIWKLLDGQHTIEEIKRRLREEYGDIERIENDVYDFLNKLIELGLIEEP